MPSGTATVHVRPVIDRDEIADLVDVQELLIELVDDDGGMVRIVEVGRKRLPDDDSDSPNWGYVRTAGDDGDEVRAVLEGATYRTATQGVREQSPATVAATGEWELARSGRTTYLQLRLERQVDEDLAEQLQLRPEAVYAITVKNPRAASDIGLEDDERPELPDELQSRFDGNRWAAVDPISFLDHPGVEFVLVPVET